MQQQGLLGMLTAWVKFNSLAPRKCGSNFTSVISEHVLLIKFISYYKAVHYAATGATWDAYSMG